MNILTYAQWITRANLQANPGQLFVFGDNVARAGRGGQAAAMRGEPNSLGVATKWTPTREAGAYFSDGDDRAWDVLLADIDKVRTELRSGKVIVVPAGGLGTGLSELPRRAPRLHRYLVEEFRKMSGPDFPWE